MARQLSRAAAAEQRLTAAEALRIGAFPSFPGPDPDRAPSATPHAEGDTLQAKHGKARLMAGPRKKIGFVFIPGFADWEYGTLAASAVEWFGAEAVSLTPGARPVKRISGFLLTPQRSAGVAENDDLDAIAVIGSDGWGEPSPPDIEPLVRAVAARGGLVGGICAGTLPLARAGLLEGRDHTSNGRDWILGHVPDYRGADRYRDVPHAVADRGIVTAPGSAPGTFAVAFLQALYPERAEHFAEMTALLAREHAAAN